MARKKKESAKKYFWKDVYVGSIPTLHAMLKRLTADMGMTNLQMLRGTPVAQTSITQETLLNAMIVYFTQKSSGPHGVKWLEDALREPFEELSRLVAEDMRQNPREVDPGEGEGDAPEGFSQPKGPKKPGGTSPRPKGRSRNGRTAE